MKRRRAIRKPARHALLWGIAAALSLAAHADIVIPLDGQPLSGDLTLARDSDTVTLTTQDGKAVEARLIDIDEVRFGQTLQVTRGGDLLLINHDGRHGAVRKTGKVKLRAGLHRIMVPYWQAIDSHKLELRVSGPGTNGEVELGSDELRCFRDQEDTYEPSKGIDTEGYRLPDLDMAVAEDRRRMVTRARYRYYTGNAEQRFTDMNVFKQVELRRSGTTSAINTGIVHDPQEYVALVFEGFFLAKKDGEFTFALTSDDGSQLYLGEVDELTAGQLDGPPVHTPWQAKLRHDGVARGNLLRINQDHVVMHIPLVSDVNLALPQVLEVWDSKVEPASVNRENEPKDQDTAYIRDKNETDKIVAVSGQVVALDETTLRFSFRGKEREINRQRLAGLVLADSSRPAPPSPGFHQVLKLHGGQVLPCKVLAIDKHVTFQMIGGGLATPPRNVMRSMRAVDGRRVDLTRVEPTAEETIPYFGLKLPSRVDQTFTGKTIKLFNNKTYERGLAVHSKSRLHYRLDKPCETFRATFGLLDPGGRLGDVTARVLGDGKVLWEQAGVTAKSGAIPVEVPLKGVKRLVLEVDFGGGQDVGDRAAWCDPQLIYTVEP